MQYFAKALSREEARGWILKQQKRYARDGHGFWLACDRGTGSPLGQCGLAMQEVDGVQEPAIGYIFHHSYWRQGLAIEAARAVRDWAFAERRMERVISLIRPINIPSVGVALKNGMTVEKMTEYKGLEHAVYSVTRSSLEA